MLSLVKVTLITQIQMQLQLQAGETRRQQQEQQHLWQTKPQKCQATI